MAAQGQGLGELATRQVQQERGWRVLVLGLLCLFHLVWDPSPWVITLRTIIASNILYSLRACPSHTPSQTHPWWFQILVHWQKRLNFTDIKPNVLFDPELQFSGNRYIFPVQFMHHRTTPFNCLLTKYLALLCELRMLTGTIGFEVVNGLVSAHIDVWTKILCFSICNAENKIQSSARGWSGLSRWTVTSALCPLLETWGLWKDRLIPHTRDYLCSSR